MVGGLLGNYVQRQAVGWHFCCVRRPTQSAKISCIWNILHKFVQLPWELKRFLFHSVLILPMTYAGLGLFEFNRLLSVVQRQSPVGPEPDRSPHRLAPISVLAKTVRRSRNAPTSIMLRKKRRRTATGSRSATWPSASARSNRGCLPTAVR
jgi:hypothetical protein